MERPAARLKRSLLAALCLSCVSGGSARAGDSWELWPQVSAYFGLSPGTRLFLDASFAEGKESVTRSAELAAYLDFSLKPIARRTLQTKDWHRARYLWARIGYDRIFEAAELDRDLAENRGIVALHARAPLPAEIWLEARLRADLRWIGDDYSTRYRLRLDASRELTLARRTVVPYVNAEAFYDMRYDGLSRLLYQAGAEVTRSEHFRYELYLARQDNRLPSASHLNALGVVAKWYY